MLCIAVTSVALRGLCARAAQRALGDAPLFVQPGEPLPPALLLVHDFLPDAMQSCAWLNASVEAARALQVIAVLDAPASPALHLLARHSHRFDCVDIVLANESTPASLAALITSVLARTDGEAVTQMLASTWVIDPLLASVARHAMAMNDASLGPPSAPNRPQLGSWPTESQLLSRAGIQRGTFVRHAELAGFRPALRFLHAVRLLAVTSMLRTDDVTIEQAAVRYGYASTGTLRRHFRELTGLSPSSARQLPPRELLRQMRATALTAVP